MATKIVFGTDGWRGVIAQDFTFDNLERVAHAAAAYFKKLKNVKRGVVVGYDARFLSREFAEATARVLASQGVTAWLTEGITTTPMVSFAVARKRCAAGIVITASHNPAIYNGFKLKGSYGGPAFPEDVHLVEENLAKLTAPKTALKSYAECVEKKLIRPFDAKQMYLDYLPTKLDLDLIRKTGAHIVYDPMYGAGIHTMNKIIPDVVQLHNEHNASFTGIDHPEPMGEYLGELIQTMRKSGHKYHVGLATDGDADRIGAVDEDGNFVDSHRLFMLTLKYLYEDKGLRGEVAKTVSLTSMVDAYCKANKIKLHETPVGFKYISKLIVERDILIGGEESGGYATSLHIPERDGIFNGLLICEMMAKRGKSLSQLVRELHAELGIHRYRRIDMRTTEEHKQKILKKAQSGIKTLGKYVVRSTNTRDGFKFMVDKGWLLIRASGTEPLLRYYAEGATADQVDALLNAGMKL
ncbi:MAG TPA: phosphoglucomutase/phosphomannomutase family protein [Candidatus Kapabacteria bacterium]|nr:phosphoglucomutase/phosphomannomutase family protein [Candidatus Kapabacteria bacterium]